MYVGGALQKAVLNSGKSKGISMRVPCRQTTPENTTAT
jgi:hypothetical protein